MEKPSSLLCFEGYNPLKARPVDAKRCRSGRGSLRNASRSLAVMDRQKKNKNKKKQKKTGAPNQGFENLRIS